MIELPPHPRYDGVQAISWSDVKAIESNPRDWYARAVGLKPTRQTPSLLFGTMVHAYIQRRNWEELGIDPIPHGTYPEETVVG